MWIEIEWIYPRNRNSWQAESDEQMKMEISIEAEISTLKIKLRLKEKNCLIVINRIVVRKLILLQVD